MLVDSNKVDSSVNVRLSQADHDELQNIAKKVGCKVSHLVRYAVKKHILLAHEEFAKNPAFWE